ncbi:hypothetical protein KY284_012967 [Solanum tuberosum]|nr:hypothetical protein KY284_012967 [Solanum tuberosum]
MKFQLVVVYGLHTIHTRLKLWEDLRGISTRTQKPMICIGDFNAILLGEDRQLGNPFQKGEIRDFNEFMLDIGMSELKSIGRTYTWSNGRTCSKIDRAIVNGEWMLNMIPMEVTVMNPGTSDHSPLSLALDRQRRCSHKAFKFFNYVAEHPEFLQQVKEAWVGGHKKDMNDIWRMLKRV